MIDVTGPRDSSVDDVIADVISVISRRSRVDELVTSTVSRAVSKSIVTATRCHLSSFKPTTNQNVVVVSDKYIITNDCYRLTVDLST